MNTLIGIAGGSGSGKSTLAYGIQEMYPDLVEVVHFDDYQKKEVDVPVQFGMKNWDHPDAIEFDTLFSDLQALQRGEDVTIMTKSRKHNPEYEKTGRIVYTMQAKPVILVEGYMALTDERIRNLYHASFFLELSDEERAKRRDKVVNAEFKAYRDKILIPMHNTYVEPTKAYADVVVDVASHTAEQVKDIVLRELKDQKILI